MAAKPGTVFVADVLNDDLAVKEARKLGIPVVAIIDTNCDPQEVDFPIPGNDDAARAIQLYCNLIADAVLDGLSESSMASGQDLGASETVREPALAATTEAEAQA
jgi:small subunit ribosomal protein S2